MSEALMTRFIYCGKHPALWIQSTNAYGATVRTCPECLKERACEKAERAEKERT